MRTGGWLIIGLTLGATAVPAAAQMQSYVIQRPGQAPIYVNPRIGGGYAVQSPGEAPIYVNPAAGGGTLQVPGQAPIYVPDGAAGAGAAAPQAAPMRRK